ncbi:MAG: curli-like amyloid fiber formation chaperone CsgH [Hyphomicrobiaceae bacterium]|nr:curli-like amyloid fiber formation chaperone CsgH [Hyphomicrobiaceae bacterium]
MSTWWTSLRLEMRVAAGCAVTALGIAVAVSQATNAEPAPQVSCTIKTSRHAGAVALEALIRSPNAVAGSFAFTVAKSGGGGSANIEQTGEFIGTGQWNLVADVQLGGDGDYVARLKVKLGGRTIECSERVKGAL